jgi:predicted TIM-barrel fold metal-dependent hydrolase
MSNYRIISSDNHVFEPPDLWTSRIDSKFKGREPHVVRMDDGADRWFTDGIKGQFGAAGSQAGVRFEEPESLNMVGTSEQNVLGGYIPEEHIKDLDIDGVDVSILYPTVGLQLYCTVPDSELLSATFRAYNDWLAEFCAPFPKRLKGIAMVNLDDVQDGLSELERGAKMGLAGAMITICPPEDMPYDSPIYEPLWAAAQDLDIPLSLHITTNRPGPGQQYSNFDTTKLSFLCNTDHWVRIALADMIYSGVFERYPKLMVGSVEQELSWVPHFLDRLDYNYTQRAVGDTSYRYKGDALPSDYFHSNVFLGFQEDGLGIKDRHIIGVDQLLWGSDYPHTESTFPRSREIIEEILADCTEEEKAKIVGSNAARIYHLD